MVGIKLVLLSSLLFFQGIQGFCINNKLTDGSSFRITQNRGNFLIPDNRRFSKHLEKDTTECCAYTTKDCSVDFGNDDLATFEIEFYFIDKSSSFRGVRCTTGGRITIRGTKEKHYAECTNAKGVTTAAPMSEFT